MICNYGEVCSRKNLLTKLSLCYVFVVSFTYDYSRHLAISSFSFYFLYFCQLFLHLSCMINSRLTNSRPYPSSPSFQFFFVFWNLSFVILIFFGLKVFIILLNHYIATIKSFFMNFNCLGKVQICSVRLIFLFKPINIDPLNQLFALHQSLFEISLNKALAAFCQRLFIIRLTELSFSNLFFLFLLFFTFLFYVHALRIIQKLMKLLNLFLFFRHLFLQSNFHEPHSL